MPPRLPEPKRAPSLPSRELILRLLHESFDGPSWHGPAVRDALRGVDHELAARRPEPGRHSIWELTLHLAALRNRLRRRIRPDSAGRFPRRMAASWWPAPPATPTVAAWRDDLTLLHDEHAELVALVESLSRADLATPLPGRRIAADQLLGAALHDTYHAGQMVLLRRLAEQRRHREQS